MSIFLNRERELASLQARYAGVTGEFLILYGRRRVGKSALIDRFLALSSGIRLLAREESKELQLRKFSHDLGEYFNDPLLKRVSFPDWDSFFEYLADHAEKRVVIAIDEFPYLVKEDPSLPSILQDHWDNRLKDTAIFLILSGSNISMVESMLMAYKSPLYGRRTGQILLGPLGFIEVLNYIGDFRKAVEFYSVFGGTPAYLISANISVGIYENIEEKILREDAYLFRDIEFVLRMELSEPRYYFSILLSIAKGNHRIGLIANDTGLAKNIVNKYLSVLIDLQLVRRMVPVTENYKSRKGLYFLADNLFDFWFRFVYPSAEHLERGESGRILDTSVKPAFNRYVGAHFEPVVQEVLTFINEGGLLPERFTKFGRWWHKEEQIDVVALNEVKKSILFCECKWQDRVDAPALLEAMKKKAPLVQWHNNERKEYFFIIARSFSKRTDGVNVTCMDLKELSECVNRKTEPIE